MQSQAAFSFLHIVSALGVAVVWIAAFSLLREPMRHKLSAIMIAGAGAAYPLKGPALHALTTTGHLENVSNGRSPAGDSLVHTSSGSATMV